MERVEATSVSSRPLPSDGELIERYIKHYRRRGSPKSSWQNYESRLRIISRFLSGIGSSPISAGKRELEALLDYLKEQRRNRYGEPLSDKNVNNYYTALSSFYNFLIWEDLMQTNLVPAFKKRYLNTYKKRVEPKGRRLISVEEASLLINGTLDLQEKTIMTVLAKTGVRKGELISMDVGDIDWRLGGIELKSKRKRSNSKVPFDEETAVLLGRWLRVRADYAADGEAALFIGDRGRRIGRNIVYGVVAGNAERVGLSNPSSPRLEDHFGPHCFRHFATTELRRAGMRREFLKELRGDSRREAVDVYDHIPFSELRGEYLRFVPRLGIL